MNAFDVLDGLLALTQSGKGIKEFIDINKISKVIIYGMGRVGIRVITAIRDGGAEVLCVADRDAARMSSDGLKIIEPKEIGQFDIEADLIVVTVVEQYYDIKEELEQITDTDIISIDEIVRYCMDGEKVGINVQRRM